LPLTIDHSTSAMVNGQSTMTNPKKRVLILHANGSNRDHDAAAAIALAGGEPEIVHVNQLFKHERNLLDYHMLVVPGGFTYGDDLGSGVLWALDLRERLGDDLAKFIASGRPVLGICNGFQALVKAGLFEDGSESPKGQRVEGSTKLYNPYEGSKSVPRRMTLTFNQRGHFECRWVHLHTNVHSNCLFTQGIAEPIYCPVAHGEGRFMVRDEAALAQLQAANRVTLTYLGEGYPANPNGSVANIAGICNAAGNVMGLMPHPENHIFYWQHPRQHRGERGLTGLRLFENGIRNA
jgi:phosphoribosylformylglycinamidine synthase subunit PurQ / glutaminase